MEQNSISNEIIVNASSKFHWLFTEGSNGDRAAHDTILSETTNFVAMPSLGSLVPGWILIVPKFPLVRFSSLDESLHEEFNAFVSEMNDKVSKFGKAYIFEHGGNAGSNVSCGVDQAHLHITPLQFDLLQSLESDKSYHWSCVHGARYPHTFNETSEYIFASDEERSIVAKVETPVSQFIRTIIAKNTNQSDKWDYKKFPMSENIEKTLVKLSAHA